ncbi:MAG TPA: nucleotidyl transferase AbiEii/AbiGii toxin family protein [Solirubrobacteraceae bacterium]|nr:nucleotidyl transferase AbiEii/AbiGii toxin family protein [Solirubrobacteraceae bacterium]
MSDEQARRVFRQLQALARADYGGNTGALLVVYGVEGFLRRLAASEYASNMTLKGGMLMAAISARRMTKDADLSTRGVGSEEERVAAVVGEIIATELDLDDGLEFDADSIRTELMREDDEYRGVRVKLIANLATARMTTTLDFSFGDPHQSTVIELPELLGTGTIRLASYPPQMSLAEKVATMMSRRELNTRDRDFADAWVFSRVRAFDAAELRSAITSVAEHRNHEIVPLSVALENMPDRQTSYTAMLDRMAYQRLPPVSWTELLADVCAFIDPLFDPQPGALGSWDPNAQSWRSPRG